MEAESGVQSPRSLRRLQATPAAGDTECTDTSGDRVLDSRDRSVFYTMPKQQGKGECGTQKKVVERSGERGGNGGVRRGERGRKDNASHPVTKGGGCLEIKGAARMQKAVEQALAALEQNGYVELCGRVGGGGMDKVVSIAEILKRKVPDLVQNSFFSDFDTGGETRRTDVVLHVSLQAPPKEQEANMEKVTECGA
uniref:Alba protein n=1 Tax=Toxoplasma gondii COUG TaxID=1074873 RepID=A0A2G8YCC4_TOXGO|nr:alba protein [Toxoplasma gondii COUG]